MSKRNLIIAGGGTGGHLFPGLAVAEIWKEQGGQVHFVGSPLGMEKDMIPRFGYPLHLLPASPIKGNRWVGKLLAMLKFGNSVVKSIGILKKIKPQAVLGIGGYASGSMIMAAWVCRYPTILIEPNAWPGLTNRIFGKWVKKVLVSFDKAKDFFPAEKVFLTGNPVLKDRLPKFTNRSWPEIPTILVCGGSQGAHHLNQVIVQCLEKLKTDFPFLQVIHQTGKADYQQVVADYEKRRIKALVAPFFDKMEEIYPRAHLALARSGAGTCTELALWQMPSILVPYPHAADNHQWWNAKELVDAGAAEVMLDSELSAEKLAETIGQILSDPKKLEAMASAAGRLAKPEAAKRVVEEIRALYTAT